MRKFVLSDIKRYMTYTLLKDTPSPIKAQSHATFKILIYLWHRSFDIPKIKITEEIKLSFGI